VLVGGGADEQLAGYARHRTHYKVDGIRGLLQEVHKDVKRLSWRNLGRDDRCIADHHKESRLPYLDEKVVDYLNKLPVWAKADLELPRGVGEKRLLREVAILLGCPTAAGLPKRAMQFGSRVASLQSTKCKGSDQSQLLL
jgi:asparagine synthetase B (glutamine-hydrolysing)